MAVHGQAALNSRVTLHGRVPPGGPSFPSCLYVYFYTWIRNRGIKNDQKARIPTGRGDGSAGVFISMARADTKWLLGLAAQEPDIHLNVIPPWDPCPFFVLVCLH